MLSEWLTLSLEARTPERPEGRIPGGRYRLLGPGLLELIPDQPGEAPRATVLSAGIHGNETAPIELLGECLARLEAGLTRLGAPVLVILGNLEAIRRAERYVSTNLNRLFRRDIDEVGMEPDRARELMAAVDGFHARHPAHSRLHYDLHTAIRDSRYPCFVVSPYAATAVAPEQWRWFAAAGIQAVLHQHRHSWTFSHYSKHYHGAQAFTLELGRALPFGHNDLAALAPMGRLLESLIAGREPAAGDPGRMAFFQVEHELMREAEAFRLCFPDDTPNFTEFAPGTLLAEDGKAGDYRVGATPLRVVFPNAQVEPGARAALLVSPASAPET
ncbi:MULTISPECIES: succinylglutamate desuccinylase [Halomonas]|uniref:Succinylglutamate desuccinylase n=1 Tax=Halomonas flagellata TaxID=2920385 RepID=A0ABS9RQM9_9GAMM|nr:MULTISPECIES: succinylglutamate desuccinylase [Halomonas]MCH4562149.1 succinylglutamate desuccinylase [Halomonas flagellata]PXY00134.1 succinylglutamate desuccinylase [Halomonas sp. LBP4]